MRGMRSRLSPLLPMKGMSPVELLEFVGPTPSSTSIFVVFDRGVSAGMSPNSPLGSIIVNSVVLCTRKSAASEKAASAEIKHTNLIDNGAVIAILWYYNWIKVPHFLHRVLLFAFPFVWPHSNDERYRRYESKKVKILPPAPHSDGRWRRSGGWWRFSDVRFRDRDQRRRRRQWATAEKWKAGRWPEGEG